MDCLRSLISTLDAASDVGFRGTGFGSIGTLLGSFLFLFLCSSCTIALVCWHCQEVSANFLNNFFEEHPKKLDFTGFFRVSNFLTFSKNGLLHHFYTISTPISESGTSKIPCKFKEI